ncbi:MAG: GNAT family N-acetyltransferase [Pseudomonadota bacterium]
MDGTDITFAGYRPGALAGVVGLHMAYYAPAWGFGLAFETKVASELAAFLQGHDAARDLFLGAYDGQGQLCGSLVIDGKDAAGAGAHLRWFIVDAAGQGLGGRLLDQGMAFCRDRGYRRVYLSTFAGLDAARRLYERHGFRLVAESEVDQWQGGVREQRFEAEL